MPFYVNYGSQLCEEVKFNGPSDLRWIEKYRKKSKSIQELNDMMEFYSIKPYHMVLVQYVGESYFKFQVYNPYAVEIEYPVHIHACTKNLVCDDTYLDKLECIYYNNVRNNFA